MQIFTKQITTGLQFRENIGTVKILLVLNSTGQKFQFVRVHRKRWLKVDYMKISKEKFDSEQSLYLNNAKKKRHSIV